jgi:hypothetical protein
MAAYGIATSLVIWYNGTSLDLVSDPALARRAEGRGGEGSYG